MDKNKLKFLSKEQVKKSLLEVVPSYVSYTPGQKEYLIGVYLKNYAYGLNVVKDDKFLNNAFITTQELKKRFNNYSEVKNDNREFIANLSKGDEDSLDLILEKTNTEDDFVYETYETNYVDRSKDLVKFIKHRDIVEGIIKEDVLIAGQSAFGEGVIKKIDFLAKQSLIIWSKKYLEGE